MVKRPKTAAEYVDLVQQALLEVEDLRMSAEYDMESMGSALNFLDRLETEVRALYQSMVDGNYQFGREDLPFMSIVAREDERVLPFKYLLVQINATHREGLDVDEDS